MYLLYHILYRKSIVPVNNSYLTPFIPPPKGSGFSG